MMINRIKLSFVFYLFFIGTTIAQNAPFLIENERDLKGLQTFTGDQNIFIEVIFSDDFTVNQFLNVDPKIFKGLVFHNIDFTNINFLKSFENLVYLEFFSGTIDEFDFSMLPIRLRELQLRFKPEKIVQNERDFGEISLVSLSLNGKWIIEKLKWLEHSTSIKRLELHQVDLTNLEFKNLPKNLNYLHLDGCRLMNLNNYDFGNLTKSLDTLNLINSGKGGLKGVQMLLGFQNLTKLEIVYSLESNFEFVNSMNSLKSLKISHTGLRGNFNFKNNSIIELDLANNNLSKINFVGSLSIMYLDISYNKLTDLPGILNLKDKLLVFYFFGNSKISLGNSQVFTKLKCFSFAPSVANIGFDTTNLDLVYLMEVETDSESGIMKEMGLVEFLKANNFRTGNKKIRIFRGGYSQRKLADFYGVSDISIGRRL